MATERNTRREILKKLLTLGPLAAVAGAIGVNGAKKAAAAAAIGDPNQPTNGKIFPGYEWTTQSAHYISGNNTGIGIDCSAGTDAFEVSGNIGLTSASPVLRNLRRIVAAATDFAFNNHANTQNNLLITDSGNVGIANPTPAYPLDVAGHIHLSGNILMPSTNVVEGTARQAYYSS